MIEASHVNTQHVINNWGTEFYVAMKIQQHRTYLYINPNKRWVEASSQK